MNQYDAAKQDLQEYLTQHTDSADANFLLGYVLFSEKDPSRSLAEYTAGAHFRYPSPEDLMAVAADYIMLKDYSDADKWLTEVTRAQPENQLAWYYLGRTRYYESKFEDAASAFVVCLRLNPHDVRAETNLGLSYEGLQKDNEAISAYHTAILWQENSSTKVSDPYLDLGSLLLRKGEVKQSIEYLAQAEQLAPRNPKLHEELGRAYDQMHEEKDAQVELEKAIGLAPDAAALHFLLGRIYREEGLKEDAQREFARTSQLMGQRSAGEVPNYEIPK
jgi:Flp pilus assembly protein TadD